MLQSHLPRRPCGGRRSKIATANSDYRVAAELPRQHTVAVTFATGAARRILNWWRQKICGCRTVAVRRPCGGRMFLTNTTVPARRPHGALTAPVRRPQGECFWQIPRRPHGVRTAPARWPYHTDATATHLGLLYTFTCSFPKIIKYHYAGTFSVICI